LKRARLSAQAGHAWDAVSDNELSATMNSFPSVTAWTFRSKDSTPTVFKALRGFGYINTLTTLEILYWSNPEHCRTSGDFDLFWTLELEARPSAN
ncbi:hypothetical protein BGZ54_004574, partial [Gamsiella multidivaricata]